jgi:hypothetical protein
MGLATTRIAVLRGTTTNDLGDEVDSTEPVDGLGDVPASLIEKSKGVQDEASGTWRSVRYLKCRVSPRLDIREGDRIRDNRTGNIYFIDELTRTPRGIAGAGTLSLDLTDTTG